MPSWARKQTAITAVANRKRIGRSLLEVGIRVAGRQRNARKNDVAVFLPCYVADQVKWNQHTALLLIIPEQRIDRCAVLRCLRREIKSSSLNYKQRILVYPDMKL